MTQTRRHNKVKGRERKGKKRNPEDYFVGGKKRSVLINGLFFRS